MRARHHLLLVLALWGCRDAPEPAAPAPPAERRCELPERALRARCDASGAPVAIGVCEVGWRDANARATDGCEVACEGSLRCRRRVRGLALGLEMDDEEVPVVFGGHGRLERLGGSPGDYTPREADGLPGSLSAIVDVDWSGEPLLAVSRGEGLYTSEDGGWTWLPALASRPSREVRAASSCPEGGAVVVAGAWLGRSEDGARWVGGAALNLDAPVRDVQCLEGGRVVLVSGKTILERPGDGAPFRPVGTCAGPCERVVRWADGALVLGGGEAYVVERGEAEARRVEGVKGEVRWVVTRGEEAELLAGDALWRVDASGEARRLTSAPPAARAAVRWGEGVLALGVDGALLWREAEGAWVTLEAAWSPSPEARERVAVGPRGVGAEVRAELESGVRLAVDDAGWLWRSPGEGAAFKPVGEALSRGLEAVAGVGPSGVAVACGGGRLLRSEDGGARWREVARGLAPCVSARSLDGGGVELVTEEGESVLGGVPR